MTPGNAFGVTFYSGLDGTGNILGTQTFQGCKVPAGLYSCWQLADGFGFLDAVYSVAFSGGANFAIDSVSFDMRPVSTAVPEPAALGMFGFGALLIGLFAGLRRRYN